MSKKQLGYRIRQGFIPHIDGVAEFSSGMTVNKNSLKKRGNVVIFDFSATCDYTSEIYAITIPEKFRPKEKTLVPITYSTYVLNGGDTQEKGTTVYLEDGKIHMPQSILSVDIRQVGWEIE